MVGDEGGADDTRAVARLHEHGNLLDFAGAEDLKDNLATGPREGAGDMAEENPAVPRILVVSILIQRGAIHGENHIALAKAGGGRRAFRGDFRNINATGLLQADVTAELGVAERGERNSKPRKSSINRALRFLQKPRNDRHGHDVGSLVSGIVAHEQSDQAAIAHGGEGEAAIPLLERCRPHVGQQTNIFERVGRNRDRGDASGRAGDLAVRFKLENANGVADGNFLVQGQGNHPIDEAGVHRPKDREVAFIIDALERGRRFLGGCCFFEFDEVRVGDKVGGDKDASFADQNTESAPVVGWLFLPGRLVVVDLIGRIHTQKRLRRDFRHGGLIRVCCKDRRWGGRGSRQLEPWLKCSTKRGGLNQEPESGDAKDWVHFFRFCSCSTP